MYNILKAFLRAVFDAAFRTKKIGAAKLRKIGRRAIFLVPHISSIDPLLLMAYMPGRPIFAMSKASYKWYVRLFLRWTDVFIIDSSNPMSVKSLISEIKKDRQAVVFVEGRLNESGMIAKMYEAPGFVAENANAPIIPVRINGVQHTFFSSLENAARRPFPRVTLTFLDPHKVPPSKYNREQRAKVGDYFYRIMQDTFYQTQIDRNSSIFAAAVDAAKLYGRRRFRRVDIMEDTDRVPHTYGDVLTRSFVLAAGINKITKPDEAVGVMLPNSVANMCAILGLSAYDRVPAMLNFAAGEHAVTDCIDTAAVQTVITSRRFVAALGLGGLVEALLKHKVDVAYAEDIESSATIFDTIAARLKYIFRHVPSPAGGKNKKAVILFTSGSTSRPKGVALSHYNILSNVAQIIATIGVGPGDVWFNALPMFHSFGLTVCTMCPFLVGAKLFLYPTPLHYRVIPELCYDIRATIMASTNTFLRNYAKYAHPYDFASMRLCINGGELLREDTRRVWNEKFGVRIIQGYGTTETSPVVTFNSPTFVRIGSIGKFVPGLEYRLEKLDGLANGGELYVRGDNVMMGYIDPDDPKKIIPPPDGWHETGDVVEVDDDGFVFITDRVKRFAKLAGEMVPLSGVEDLVKDAYNDDKDLDVGAVSVPDDMKGEKIVLVSTHQTVGHAAVANYAKIHGISERFVPKTYLYTDELPLLKTGKRDYVGLKRWVMDELGPKAQ